MQNAKPVGRQETAARAVENCLPKGTRLADFEIIGVIGEGGFGIVYFAFDRSLRRMVAIKEYMPGAFAGRGPDKKVVVRSQHHRETFTIGLKSFIKEARLLAQFDHPALTKVYRFWEQNNTAYMAMRYYEGRTLKRVVQNAPALITEAWLKSMLKPMLEALVAMYRVQILHRDISPDNIMIQKNGEAVLLDFGAARQIIGDMTHSLTVILRPGYAPIEQYADDAMTKQGPWTDIYSLSAVIYFAIVKTAPPTSVARMIKDPIELLQNGQYPGFSRAFLAAIDKGLAVRPADRPQSIEEFRQLLDLELSIPIPMPDGDVAVAISARSRNSKPDDGRARALSAARSSGGKPLSAPAPRATIRATIAEKLTRAPLLWTGAVLCVVAAGAYLSYKPAAVAIALDSRLPAVPSMPQPAFVAPLAAAEQVIDEESIAWEALKQEEEATLPEVSEFIQNHPNGEYVEPASVRLSELQAEGAAEHAASPTAVKAPGPTGIVTLTIKPWGKVLVGGSMKGVSPPLKKLVLPEGKHRIRVVNPSFPDHVVEIDVTKKKSRNIDYDFSLN